jgi:SOS-response transcriptional repressor LexA
MSLIYAGNCPDDKLDHSRDNSRIDIEGRMQITKDEKARLIAQRAMDSAARTKNISSDRQVSIEATGRPDLIRDMRRGRMPSADTIAKLAGVVGLSASELLNEDEAVLAPKDLIPPSTDLPADVPILGTALGADLVIDTDTQQPLSIEQTIVEPGEVVGYMRRLPALDRQREIYALYVVGSSMSPRFEPGEAVYVSPRRPPNIGDDVIVQVAEPDFEAGHEVRSVLVKRLVRRTAAFVELEQFNPPIRFKIETSRISAVHRVLPWSELLTL